MGSCEHASGGSRNGGERPLFDMERHYKAVKDKWYGFGGGLKE
jgi:hypothetical protein